MPSSSATWPVTPVSHRIRWRVLAGYVLMLAAAVGLFLLVQVLGARLEAPPAPVLERGPAKGPGQGHLLPHVLATLAAVIALGQFLGRLLARFGQPPVIGEVLAGIALGPSLLGWLWPGAPAALLPDPAAAALGVVAQLGVILFLFLVGLELNTGLLRQQAHVTVAISHASIVVPFVLGAALALLLYPRVSHAGVPFTSFALFMGIALSITAFPVLARILRDRHLEKTQLGIVALTCAATDDVTAWCLLALGAGVVRAKLGDALAVLGFSALFIGVMLLLVRPLLLRWLVRKGQLQQRGAVAGIFVLLLLCALATEWIGIHALFGAFLLGAVIPHDQPLARTLTHKLEDLVTLVLLPAFFAYTGLRTQIGLLTTLEDWFLCGLIILVACGGKYAGTALAARWLGLGWFAAHNLGILMNTRGLMELIVLNVGLELGVISPRLHAMMVLMALVTTLMAAPLLARSHFPRWNRELQTGAFSHE